MKKIGVYSVAKGISAVNAIGVAVVAFTLIANDYALSALLPIFIMPPIVLATAMPFVLFYHVFGGSLPATCDNCTGISRNKMPWNPRRFEGLCGTCEVRHRIKERASEKLRRQERRRAVEKYVQAGIEIDNARRIAHDKHLAAQTEVKTPPKETWTWTEE